MKQYLLHISQKFIMMLMVLCLCVFSFNKSYAAEEHKLGRDYVNAYFTTLAAASCLGEYISDESMAFNYMRIMGWKIEPRISRLGKLETHFSVARRYFKNLDRQVFLVTFRGSATKADWKINLKTKKVNYGGNTLTDMEALAKAKLISKAPGVHKGFNEYANNVLHDSVVAEDGSLRGVFGYVKETPNAHLILTGHSMGGAVATLLATRLADLGFPKERLHVLSFGAPAVGNVEYNEAYANKLHIVRITNTNDPIPGSLQTFVHGYEQCGENVKYHLSNQIGNVQHDMAMYFDHSIIDLYAQEDAEIAAGRLQPLAKRRIIKGKPVVAMWAEASPGLSKMPLMPDLKRMLLSQYTKFIPSYIILNDNVKGQQELLRDDIISASAKAGADYVIVCRIDSQRYKDKDDSWFIIQEQSLFRKDGSLMTMTNYAKRVTPSVGNVQAAGEACLEAFSDLQNCLPFIGELVEDNIQ